MHAPSRSLRVSAIVPAAGSGTRFGAGRNKTLLLLEGEPLIAHVVRALGADPRVVEIVLVGKAAEREELLRAATRGCAPRVALRWAAGGAERRDSVRNGLEAADPTSEILLVHDGARPFLSAEVLARVIDAAVAQGAALCTLPAVDTVKRVDAAGRVLATLDRREIHLAQTPQAFRRELGLPAYRRACEEGWPTTDDVHVLELAAASGALPSVVAVPGDPRNRKITVPADLPTAHPEARAMNPPATGGPSFRVGSGFDLHRMVEGRPCILGGVRFEHDRGPLGHSDGDALLHALTDALLGAAGLDDLGTFFPDSDPRWKGADSAALLREAWTRVREQGYTLENCDLVVIAEKPKLAPRRAELRARIAALLEVEIERVNLKGKTAEKLGPIGAGEAIVAQATVLLRRG
ncbi:MAG: 2-C-methyl-D-erythritol 2,4-cyclodiphosphate synthase [Planctomycetes bacterium]|nr:2-C-methyl-D-erythritol 2,4-cyclodiphosphate synthase [Planctomycetota bacterium]